MAPSISTGPPSKTARLASGRSTNDFREPGTNSYGLSDVATTRLAVFARLPTSCPYVGNFHYAPSAGNRAYSFFEGQIIPNRETERLHKIRTNSLTGNFHSRPGHYSRLHGLHNFRKNADRVKAGDDGMRRIIARIKTTLMEPSSSATAEATAKYVDLHARGLRRGSLERDDDMTHGRHPRSVSGAKPKRRSPLSASDATLAAATEAPQDEREARARDYQKYWEEADTERGRFGSSVDDNALGGSSYSQGSSSSGVVGWDGVDPLAVAAAAAVGAGRHGRSGVHWGKHHHHHGRSNDEGTSEPLIGDATAKLRHLYFQREATAKSRFPDRPRGSPATSTSAAAEPGSTGVGNRDFLRARAAIVHESAAAAVSSRRGPVVVWGVDAAEKEDTAGSSGSRRSVRRPPGRHGWESHTLKAQQKTEEYMQGREDIAPDMRQNVVLDKQLSDTYDMDVSDAGILGSGAYSTVFAAVHRSTGKQVAIKIMLKRYLFSDAEKASVEREIEIQQRLVNNHTIRLYEIFQSPEKLCLVLERAPCGSLEEFLFVHGWLNELDAKHVVRELLEGVAYLHKVGVVHCDLKPANVLLSNVDQGAGAAMSADGRGASGGDGGGTAKPRARSIPPESLRGLVVKICDFGHARKVPDCRYYKFTGSIHKIPFHMFKHTGTEGFVAPEVLLQEPYGKAADMWSTGCILYNMLSGRMPWIPSRACLQRPLSMSGFTWKDVSPEAKSLVEDLLHTDQGFRADVDQAVHHPWLESIQHCARMPRSAPGAEKLGVSSRARDVASRASSAGSRSKGAVPPPESVKAAHDQHGGGGALTPSSGIEGVQRRMAAAAAAAADGLPELASAMRTSSPSAATRLRATDLPVRVA